MSLNRGSCYHMDLFVAWFARLTLLLGLSFVTFLVGCSRTNPSTEERLPFSISENGDRVSETRNYPPPITGGSNEKSDCAPSRKPAE